MHEDYELTCVQVSCSVAPILNIHRADTLVLHFFIKNLSVTTLLLTEHAYMRVTRPDQVSGILVFRSFYFWYTVFYC